MKTLSILLCLILMLIFCVCAAVAFFYHLWILGALYVLGAIAALFGMLKVAGAWSSPKPWDGDGE